MGAYLTIISGAIKFFNYCAAALQQHHDELNGSNAQNLATKSATLDELKAVSAPVSNAERDELWDANRQKFGPDSSGGGN